MANLLRNVSELLVESSVLEGLPEHRVERFGCERETIESARSRTTVETKEKRKNRSRLTNSTRSRAVVTHGESGDVGETFEGVGFSGSSVDWRRNENETRQFD